LAAAHSPSDPQAEARLVEEAKAEEKAINRICDELNVRIHEARFE
jgi:OTU domain-containing protein 6